jgi:hypothetical protein
MRPAGTNVPGAMADKRKSRKRRRSSRPGPPPRPATRAPRGYERSRAKDAEARAALEPLRPGQRPTAVTVGAIAAAVLALANLIAFVFGYDSGDDALSPSSDATGGIIVTVLLGVIAYGMWRARYWAVLGMQTLLALTMVVCALALLTAVNLWALLLVLILLTASGTLFWFLVKAMARIQMPERPGSQRSGR